MEAKNLADIYDLPLLDWARIEARLDQGLTQAPDTGGPTVTPPGWRRSTPTGARTSPVSGRDGSAARSGS
jgi:hypothetical protein